MAMMLLSSYTLFILPILVAITRKMLQGLAFVKNYLETGTNFAISYQKHVIQRRLEWALNKVATIATMKEVHTVLVYLILSLKL